MVRQLGLRVLSAGCLLLLLSGCNLDLSLSEQEEVTTPQRIVGPKVTVQESYYQGVLPYQTSPTRGMQLQTLTGLNSSHFELGLMEVATRYFPTEEYFFQEGQLIQANEVVENTQQVNALLRGPLLLTVLEYNFLTPRGELGGVVMGLVVQPSYMETVQEEGQEVERQRNWPPEEMIPLVQTAAAEWLSLLRQKMGEQADVPVVFAAMQVSQDRLLPGTFIAEGFAKAGENEVKQWKTVNESFLLMPSTSGSLTEQQDQANRSFRSFQGEVEQFFPNFIGVTATGRFIDQQLSELTVNMTAEYTSKAQISQLAQFSIALLQDSNNFPKDTHINLYIQSINEPQAVYVRRADGSEFLHLYR